MKDKELVLLVAEGCPSCDLVKKLMKGKARIMDVSKSDEAAKIALDLGVMSVPTFVMVDSGSGKMCLLDKSLNPTKCVNADFKS